MLLAAASPTVARMGTHDALFKHAFSNVEHARGVLASALPPEIAARIDFSSLAIRPTTFVPETLRDAHADMLYAGRVGGRDGFVYLLWEHKSSPEPLTVLQVLKYMLHIWEHHLDELAARRKKEGEAEKSARAPAVKLPVIVVIVLHHGPGGWTAATTFQELLDADEAMLAALGDHVPRLRLVVDDLAAQSDDSLYGRATTAFARLVLWCLKNARDAGWLGRENRRWRELIGEVLSGPEGMKAVATIFRYIAGTNPTVKPDALRGLLPSGWGPEVEEAVMNWFQEQIEQKGREAELKGQRGLLLKQLRLKFGELPAAVVLRVDQADASLLDLWAGRVLTAPKLDEVLGSA